MNELPEIHGVPEVTVVDAHRVIAGLAPYVTYMSSDIYKRYAAMCRQDGRTPGSPVALGRKLRHIGCFKCKKGTGKKARAAWRVVPGAQDPRWADGTWV